MNNYFNYIHSTTVFLIYVNIPSVSVGRLCTHLYMNRAKYYYLYSKWTTLLTNSTALMEYDEYCNVTFNTWQQFISTRITGFDKTGWQFRTRLGYLWHCFWWLIKLLLIKTWNCYIYFYYFIYSQLSPTRCIKTSSYINFYKIYFGCAFLS